MRNSVSKLSELQKRYENYLGIQKEAEETKRFAECLRAEVKGKYRNRREINNGCKETQYRHTYSAR